MQPVCRVNFTFCVWPRIRSPHFGVGRRVLPRFVPICSNFPVFFRFVPISPFSSDLFRFALLVFAICSDLFRFAPFSSDLFRFVFRTNQNRSGKPLSADPFCKSLKNGPSRFPPFPTAEPPNKVFVSLIFCYRTPRPQKVSEGGQNELCRKSLVFQAAQDYASTWGPAS